MPLTLTATPGADDANAYATVAEADEYASYRLGANASAWAASSDSDAKIRALVTATLDIDTLIFIGSRATDDQALEWPRVETVYDDDELPPSLVEATIGLALTYFANATTSDVTNSVVNDKRSVQDGDTKVEWFQPSKVDVLTIERFPDFVQRLLAGLILSEAAAGWGSGVVVRAS